MTGGGAGGTNRRRRGAVTGLAGRSLGRLVAAAVAGCLVLVAGCGGGPERPAVLADLADEAIVPAYRQFDSAATALHAAAVRLCDAPSEAALADARTALDAARSAWAYSEPMWVGPVMDRRSWAVVRWPAAVDEIKALIADTSIELDRDRLANRIGADQRGLGAVEHVLYTDSSGAAGTASAVLSALADPRRCGYLRGVTEVVAEEAAVVAAGWTEDWDGAGPYRDQFSAEGGDGLDSIVNDTLFLLERITDLELGPALGAMGSEVRLDAIDEGPAAAGAEDLVSRLDGVRAVLIGDQSAGAGLAPLLGDELTGRLSDQLAAARAAASGLEPPLRRAAATSSASVAAARDAVKVIQITVATEVVGRLGVTIGFSDADGDSSG